ncbi:xanthine dehydrogenase family protein molybdopterin-binding subunit [Umezawaea beigongshangensis]|uniref:xanthine dehydrogenase family protein molybdopterin-binding subunit n=1 Tax=Umezawaea beigongshangensis TaxID=2780383 RepID=UPI0018F1E96D|nr:xanthine dehydrogenase family protein molybdopterin-binding subunit [Umezawaea beigongshangensis]
MTTAPARPDAPPTGTSGPYVGAPVDRVDGVVKTTGAARFAAEHPYPGLAHAALVHATIPRGRVTWIDSAAALAVDGVLAVITHENAPAMRPVKTQSVLDLSTLVPGSTVNHLASDEVHWDGQPVAVVVAESRQIALHAASLVRATYRELPSTVDFATEKRNALPQKKSVVDPGRAAKGDAEAALSTAAVAVDHLYTTPVHHHNALELHTTTAVWDGDRLTVHEPTQGIDWTRKHLAHRFGVPVENVRVIAPFVGGAFGGKWHVWAGTLLTVLAARVVGRPVRLVLTREGVYRTVGGRSPSEQRVALGADADGTLTALIHTSVTQVGRVGGGPEPATGLSRYAYAAENVLVEQKQIALDLVPNTYMRAPGEAIGSFALESAIDELAHELGVDPIELRMRNEPERDPIDGRRFSHRKLREVYALGAERFGWAGRSLRPRSTRDGRWLVGTGVATAFHPANLFPANVTVRISADGGVLVRCGLHEMGMGAATAQAQIAADALGVPIESVRVEHGDSTLPAAPAASGSTQTASIASSLLAACEKLKRSALALARGSADSPLRGAKPAEVQARDGGLHAARGGETYAAILARAGRSSLDAAVGAERGFAAVAGQVRFMSKFLLDRRRWVRAASGAQFCEVRVDAHTGEVRVTRWVGAFDVGTVINAKTVASQLRGGIVMGIGMALSEATVVDPRTGRIVNPGLAEYHVPVHADVPPIEIHCLGDPDPTMPAGVLGAGEVGITGVAAAIANAVHHATGRRVRDLPVTLDDLL